MTLRRSVFEVRVNVSAMLPEGKRVREGDCFGPLRCTGAKYYGKQMSHIEFSGDIRAYKRWAVASKMMQHLHKLIEDGTEVVFYIEEKTDASGA